MTTIAYRKGILAADIEVTGAGMAWATTSKVFGTRFAMAGVAAANLDDLALFQAWFDRNLFLWKAEGNLPDKSYFADGPESKTPDRCEAILVFANGRVYSWQGTPLLKSISLCRTDIAGLLPTDQPGYVAIGSGEKYAMAAMACGMPAEAAVTVACRLQGFSAMQRIETLSFDFIVETLGENGIYGLTAPDNRPVPQQADATDMPYPSFPPKPETLQ